MKRIYLYTLYERFWHWAQTILIFTLIGTGFEIYGDFSLLGFERAIMIHNIAGFTLIVLALFTMFWFFATGEWRQFLPNKRTERQILPSLWYVFVGIFRGSPHPMRKTRAVKLNPLQQFAYLSFKLLIFPVIATSGVVYFFFDWFENEGIFSSLEPIALIHVAGAFLLVTFIIIHVYMTTTEGRTPLSNVKSMVTGYKEIHPEEEGPDEPGKRILDSPSTQ